VSWFRKKTSVVELDEVAEEITVEEPKPHPAHVRIGMAAILNQEMYGGGDYRGRHRRELGDG
jgi:hypothetical protein